MQIEERVIGGAPAATLFCAVTDRIVIVSPRPASLRALVAELSDRCYDVLLFHRADEPMIAALKDYTLVIDRTSEAPGYTAAPTVRSASVPTLTLVRGDRPATAEDGPTLVWPCPVDEAVAAIDKLSSGKPAEAAAAGRELQFKDVRLDPERMTVTRAGARVDLTRTEFELLKALFGAEGKVLARHELMNRIWGESYAIGSNSVDVHIKSLRHKLGDDPKRPRYIATVRSVGYRLADV